MAGNFFKNIFGTAEPDEGFVDYDEAGYDASSSAVTEEEADYASDYAEQTQSRFGMKKNNSSSSSRVINMHSSSGGKLAVLFPTSYEEVMKDAVDYLKDNAIVFLNLDNVEADAKMRIVDFMAGVCTALDGKMKKTGTCSYAVAPKNVEWINDIDDFTV